MNGRLDRDVLNDGMGIECWVKVSGFGLIVRFVIWAGVEELIAWLCCWVMGGVWMGCIGGVGSAGVVWLVRVLCE